MTAPLAADFQLGNVQAVLFTEPDGFSVNAVMRSFFLAVPEFDGDPKTLGDETVSFPAEVPRVFLHARSGGWRCQIAPARIDVFWSRSDGGRTQLADVLAEASRLLRMYLQTTKRSCVRVAAVVTRYAPRENPGLTLARHFCQERWHEKPLNRPESFELHAHKSYDFKGFVLNSWLRAKSGVMTERGSTTKVILVEQDLNTVARATPVSDDDVSAFYLVSPTEFDDILGLYFPNTR